jgi:hypothetical protein
MLVVIRFKGVIWLEVFRDYKVYKNYLLRIQLFRDYWVNEVSVIMISGYM